MILNLRAHFFGLPTRQTNIVSSVLPRNVSFPRAAARDFRVLISAIGFLLGGVCLPAEGEAPTLDAAVALFNHHQLAKAQKAFEALVATNPGNSDVPFYLGQIALQRGEREKAVAYLEKAVALSPKDSRMHMVLGDAYGVTAQNAGFFSQLGWAKKCEAEYERAIELDPKNIDARWDLMEYCCQAPSIAGGGKDKAMEQAQAIGRLDATRGHFAAATVYSADNNSESAFTEFAEVVKAEPGNYGANYQMGRLAAQTGQRLEEGLAALRRCLSLDPPENVPGHAAAHWRIGNILELQGDKVGARAAYEASLKADPKFSKAIDSLKNLK